MKKKLLMILFVFFSFLNICYGEEVTVGTIERQPFVIETDSGLTGFSIELWEEISQKLELDFKYKKFDTFSDMLIETEFNKVDLSIANISITSSREKVMDYSGPIFDSGITMMVKKSSLEEKGFTDFLKESHYGIVLILSLFFLSGGLFLITKKKYKKEFYIASIIYFLLFVGIGVSDYTSYKISIEKDSTYNIETLKYKNIGTILGSTGEHYLNDIGVDHRHYKTMEDLYNGLNTDKINLIIHDLPILQYYAQNNPEYTVVGEVFRKEQYGVLFPDGSELRESVNVAILELKSSGRYEEIFNKYFGEY